MSFNPKRRYSAVMSEDLERVVLIHKLRPAWQAGKANLPGGKVETSDWPPGGADENPDYEGAALDAYHACAIRETREETGLDIDATALQLFCRLRFVSREGDAAECCFYACRGDVDASRTMETERVFAVEITDVFHGDSYHETYRNSGRSEPCLRRQHKQSSEAAFLTRTCTYPRCLISPTLSPWRGSVCAARVRGRGR